MLNPMPASILRSPWLMPQNLVPRLSNGGMMQALDSESRPIREASMRLIMDRASGTKRCLSTRDTTDTMPKC
jgi:hypothetical protein